MTREPPESDSLPGRFRVGTEPSDRTPPDLTPARPARMRSTPSHQSMPSQPSHQAHEAMGQPWDWLRGPLQRIQRIGQRVPALLPTSFTARARTRRFVVVTTIVLLLALAAGIAGTSITVGMTVSDLRTALSAGEQHLSQVEHLAAQLGSSPFDQNTLVALTNEVGAAEQNFVQAQRDVNRLGLGGLVPGVGVKVSEAQALLEMAVDLTSGGRAVLEAAVPLVGSLRSPLAAAATPTPSPGPHATPSPTPSSSTPPPGGSQLTMAQLTALQQAIATFTHDLDDAAAARSRIHDNGASLDASVPHLLARYDATVTQLQPMLKDADALVRAAPVLLGVAQPASYLVEILDETELRGGGGFIGNYGIVTVSGGHATGASVNDIYLLDDPYLAKHTRAFPANYAWFPITAQMGLRDSNLSPDFVYNAQLAEQIYAQESGQSVEGVAAFTPALIAQLLTITGPIVVPGYNVTVTSQNLVSTIHYYEGLTNDQGVPSGDGVSSTRKHFTAMLGQTVFGRLRTLPQSDFHRLLTLGSNGLKTKDLQLYLSDAGAQSVLTHAHLANTLAAAPTSSQSTSPAALHDTLVLVDNDIGANKAYLYVNQSASDAVALQADGSAHHTLSVQYRYHPTGSLHGSSTFIDEVQVFVPTGSTLTGHTGLDALDAAGNQLGRAVFGGRFSLAPNRTRTVTLSWTVPASAKQGKAYELFLSRQAGSVTSFALAISLPQGAKNGQADAPLALQSGAARYQTSGALVTDLDFRAGWQ